MEGGAVGHNFERDTPRDHLCQVWTPYIDAYCQVLFHLAKLFQRRKLNMKKLTDGRRTPSDGNTSHGPGEQKK